MHKIVAIWYAHLTGIAWRLHEHRLRDRDEGLRIAFPFSTKANTRDALRAIRDAVQGEAIREPNGATWLYPHGAAWQIDIANLRKWLSDDGQPGFLGGLEWLDGVVSVEPHFENFGEGTTVQFNIYKEEYMVNRNTKLFLSHKGSDKPMVQRFFAILKELGFDPWLDEDAMVAGTELERAILDGFQRSCAAVFFITPNFQDEKYLRSEINYAVQQKREKDGRFAIITLLFTDKNGAKGAVPDLLRTYV